jgi:hypothetical protein
VVSPISLRGGGRGLLRYIAHVLLLMLMYTCSQAHGDAAPTVQDFVQDTVLLKQADHTGFTASTSHVAATDMERVDLATVSYTAKERRREAKQ